MAPPRACLPLLLLLTLLLRCSGDLEPTFSRCCGLGTRWALDSPGQPCTVFPAPVAGVPPEQQSVCLSTVSICCLNTQRHKQCDEGKTAAQTGSECVSVGKPGGEYHKDCCEACKLGLFSGSMNMGCSFNNFSFGYPWDEAYRVCCLEAVTTTTAMTFPSSSSSSTRGKEDKNTIPTPSLDSLCDLLPGQLCAHICIPEPGSYRCACKEGFSLMADKKTCQQNEIADRCKTNNPCEQKCLDTGFSIECSCAPGYTLALDETSCDDIDECALKMDLCTENNLICKNENGSYSCVSSEGDVIKPPQLHNPTDKFPISSSEGRESTKCPTGFHYNLESSVCDDIDECTVNPNICGSNVVCQNTIGSYSCSPAEGCPPGYEFSSVEKTCVDINECEAGFHNCDSQTEFCLNTEGSFTCQTRTQKPSCPAGYKLGAQPGTCEDIDECADGTHLCNQSEFCINERGAYRCQPRPRSISCSPGFKSHATLNTCVDIDECSESIQPPCEVNQICVNQPGGYECKCKPGFQFDIHVRACVDINECQTNQHECTASQRCDNTLGSYQCIRFTSCGTGYTLNAQTGQCEDDDECLLGTDNCKNLGPTFQCRNIAGSFRCDRKRCGEKQVLQNNGECKDVTCPPGLIPGPYGTCVDINECEKENPCRRNQRCINTRGSFRCINLINCGGGFQLNEAGTQCIDIDECALGTHECTSQQTCHNRQGGYTCQCPPGHTVNENRECEDVDECADFPGQFCPSNSICENTVGSYHCRCNDGFKSVPGEKACADIDECTERPGVCHQKCINVWGSYRCICDQGYALQGDGRTCRDIDECDEFKDRNLCIGLCVNEPGKYKCECPEGYRLGSDGRTCQDINECATGTPCRGDNEVCVNTLGGHRCPAIHCPAGFSKDPSHRNRCKRDHIACHEGDLNCLRRPSSYSYNFISFVSNILIPPTGHLDLFTMRGLVSAATVSFNMDLTEVRAPPGIIPASKSFFQLRRGHFNQGVIALVRPIKGPQEIELQLVMELHQNELYINRAIAKLIIYVSEFEF
ncbi:hypothetical protein R5R35_010542 [Gryllus longicercus]|uniref:EGF-like domain-containing protein n=1 Tax=Gryllus longicercus TaxID=2509291 RepID=A0AAN9VEP1_9ORTH